MALLRVLFLFLLSAFIAWPAFAAATCTPVRTVQDGREYIILQLDYSAIGASGEATCTGLPSVVTALAMSFTLTSGSATMLSPIGGTATNPTAGTTQHRFTTSSSGTHISEVDTATWYLPGGSLYIRPVPNAASDNAVTGYLILVRGAL